MSISTKLIQWVYVSLLAIALMFSNHLQAAPFTVNAVRTTQNEAAPSIKWQQLL